MADSAIINANVITTSGTGTTTPAVTVNTNVTQGSTVSANVSAGGQGIPGPQGDPGTPGPTDHTLLTNIGTNTHAQIDTALTRLAPTSNTNTGDETLSTIKTKLGVTTLSGSNTGDQSLAGLGGVPTTRQVAGHALSADVTVSKADVGLGNVANTDLTAAVAANTAKVSFDSTSSTRLANTSGTNTGDNAPNSQYSGLAASKLDLHAKADTAGAADTAVALATGADRTKLDAITGTNTGDQTLPVKAIGSELDALTDDAKFVTAKAVQDGHKVPHAAPGTSGNILQSDGTDWIAVAEFDATALTAEAIASTSSVGTATTAARRDHRHAMPTALAALSSLGGGYAACATAIGTAAKTVALTGYTLVVGGTVGTTFTNGNSAAAPTLNINSAGAKPIFVNGAAATTIPAGYECILMYDGTNYVIIDDGLGTTAPTTQAFGDSAVAGTSIEMAHVDHKHAMPAAPTLAGLGGAPLASPTFTGVITTPSIITTNNAVTVASNAATVPVTSRLTTVTNNAAGAVTITITTTSATDGQLLVVRFYDYSGATQTLAWTNTENSTVSVPTTSNGSTTLPLTVGFMYNLATTKWRCMAAA